MNQIKLKTVFLINDHKKIAWLVAVLWSYSIFTLLVNILVNFAFPNTPLDTMLCYGIVVFFVVLALRPIIKRLNIYDAMFFSIVLIIFLLSLLFYPDNYDNIIGILPRFFLLVFPYYFLGRAIKDFEILTKCLKPISKYVILAATACYLITVISGGNLIDDDMSFSYYLLPSVLLMIFVSLENGGFNWLFAILGIIVAIFAGTRGPLVCILSFFMLYLLLNLTSFRTVIKYIPLFVLGALMAFSDIFIKWITVLNNTMIYIGINLRIIQQFISNTFHNSSSRDVLYERVINGIKMQPLQGYGLMGDRNVLAGFAYGVDDTYAHNILLEMWCQFGIIFGSILILALFLITFKALIKENNRNAKHVIAILISLGLVKLLMSSSYLFEPYLFLLLGICANSIRIHKMKFNYFKELDGEMYSAPK